MAKQKSSCASENHDPGQKMTKKGCCEDYTVVLEGSEELNMISSVAAPDFQMAAVLYTLVSFMFTAPEADYYTYNDYSPPLIERDIPVLVQSFLI